MYDNTTRSFTAQDASGSYDWIVENCDRDDYLSLTDKNIYAWVDTIIDQSKTTDLYAIEDKAETLNYPRFGYTTADRFENAEEWLAFKRQEIEQDYLAEREYVFAYLKAWIAGNEQS